MKNGGFCCCFNPWTLWTRYLKYRAQKRLCTFVTNARAILTSSRLCSLENDGKFSKRVVVISDTCPPRAGDHLKTACRCNINNGQRCVSTQRLTGIVCSVCVCVF
jgi:hypothetical protein